MTQADRTTLSRPVGERDHLLVRADDLDESPPYDELPARGAVVGPQACDSCGPLVELSSEVCPDRRADAVTAKPRVDREPGEVSAGIETARLVVDLAVADRSVLLVDGDNADPLVSRVVPPAILIARGRHGDVALLGQSLDSHEGRVIAVREGADPLCHTRRPGSTPDSRMKRRVGSSSPIVVDAPCPG